MREANLTGAITAMAFYVTAALVFILRMAGYPKAGFWIGIAALCLAVPLVWLLWRAPALQRPPLYYVLIALVLAWLIAELLLDYILKADFRGGGPLLISYVVLFFAAGGGLIGMAFQAGKAWGIVAITMFLITAALAFIQRFVTGK